MQNKDIVAAIDVQISQLQRARALLTGGETVALTGKKRGRPKGSKVKTVDASIPSSAEAGKRTMTPDGRARIAAAQKARWAAMYQAVAKKTAAKSKPAAKKFVAKPKPAKKKLVPAKKAVAPPVESPAETAPAEQ